MRTQPVFLNLLNLKFPITAIVSILHRITGVILFLLIPGFLVLLNNLMHYASGTGQVINYILGSDIKCFIVWLAISALVYHLLAGIRHLIMDSGFLENKRTAQITSYIVLIISALLSVLIGIRLC